MNKAEKQWWQVVLTPGWIITAILIIAFTYTAFTVLAPWQLGKNVATVERNDRITTAFETDPVAFGEVFTPDNTLPVDKEWRRVEMVGHYLPDAEVLLRLRPVNSQAGYQVLTVFEITAGDHAGTVVTVNRGFLQMTGGTVPQFDPAPAGEVTVVGYAQPQETSINRDPVEADGYTQVFDISPQSIAAATSITPIGPYVQLAEGQPGVAGIAIPIPKLDRGPYLSYGIQWIAMGIGAPIALGYFIWAQAKERRRDAAEEAELAALIAADTAATPAGLPTEPTQAAPVAPTRSRYGERGNKNPWEKWANRGEQRF